MARIAICNPSIEEGDAISNDMMGMRNILSALGHDVCLFAQSTTINEPYIRPVAAVRSFLKDPHDIAIYHYATGWEFGLALLQELHCRKVVKYHNVTPPECFVGINEDYVNVCRAGRQQLADLARINADVYLPDSEYSRQELIAAGIHDAKCRVVPPFHNIERMRDLEADLEVLKGFQDGDTNILMVGRLAPNKNHGMLIDVFYLYHRMYHARSRLFIVGGEDSKLRTYTETLINKVKQIGLEERIIFTGKVSDPALKAYYLLAHVFVITSLHEGFCVPLIEAMSMKIPIVAYGSTAVPETVGKVGLVWRECDPKLMAASIDTIVRDESLSLTLGEMGWNRYTTRFTNNKIGTTFLNALHPLL
jgi:glycosyltransferase involved in cell wall biosynthesis